MVLIFDSAAWCVLGPVEYAKGETLRTVVTMEDVP